MDNNDLIQCAICTQWIPVEGPDICDQCEREIAREVERDEQRLNDIDDDTLLDLLNG